MSAPLVTLYYRRECHLCEQMLAEIHVHYGTELEVAAVDVDSDPALKDRYGLQVPVLTGRQGVLCHGRLDPAALEDYLEFCAREGTRPV